jgi:XTP/dITP diphosphohydrolase
MMATGLQLCSRPQKVVIATSNIGKFREIAELLFSTGITPLPQSHFEIGEVAETGLTFVENALLKARNAAAGSGLSAIADDSGLEVDALDGAPGIYSARYAGKGASDQDNLEKLLRDMEHVPEAARTARFHCVAVYLRQWEDPTPIICHGLWEGQVLFEPRGINGFGYDPIFYVPSHGCSSAELPPEVKNQLSHRGQALRGLGQLLSKRYAKCS